MSFGQQKNAEGPATRPIQMNPDLNKRKSLCPTAVAACFVFLSAGLVPINGTLGAMPAGQDGDGKQASILKGKAPVEIEGIVVAMNREAMDETPYYSADILLLKIEKLLRGKDPGRFVRTDFVNNSVTTDSQEARVFRQLDRSLHEGRKWRIRLRPPRGSAECAWLISPPPRPEELTVFRPPIIVAVGGAKGYPDINTLPCYAFEVKDIEEITSPEKAK